jgi:two-component sensor histidine kinase/AmiR/NasT family two-component response regulator
MNILIVEDNADDRRLLRFTLEHHGCRVIEAQDGQEGLDLASRHLPDIIVSDALMPRMDGFQMLRALKSDPHLKSIPFLFYSATYTGEQEEKLALSLGAQAFVAKPTEPEKLWEKTSAIMKAAEARQEIPADVNLIESEEEYLREYGRIVATKLEKKVRELEEALALRNKAEDELRRINTELTREMGERRKGEEKIRASLAEKEVLLKEVHHRVKNNLQIITTLLDLQFDKIDDKQALAALMVSQDRIKSIALVHEKLYQTKDLARIDFAGYIENLTSQLFSSYVADPERVTLKIDAGDVALGIDEAIPCGLIINELVSNSLKHAFPEGRKGNVAIRFQADEQGVVTLMVADDGIGLPPGMNFRDTGSMGLQLVNMLTKQIHGEISLLTEGGVAFTIRFKA